MSTPFTLPFFFFFPPLVVHHCPISIRHNGDKGFVRSYRGWREAERTVRRGRRGDESEGNIRRAETEGEATRWGWEAREVLLDEKQRALQHLDKRSEGYFFLSPLLSEVMQRLADFRLLSYLVFLNLENESL